MKKIIAFIKSLFIKEQPAHIFVAEVKEVKAKAPKKKPAAKKQTNKTVKKKTK